MNILPNISQQQEKKVLFAALAVLAALIVYRLATMEGPRTAPLAFPPGSVSTSAVRQGLTAASADARLLSVFLEKHAETFPGVARDIFKMEDPAAPRPKTAPVAVAAAPPPVPDIPQRTPEEIAADLSRAELAKFRFLGYLTDKESTLFLSKDGELFLAKSGDTLLRNYRVRQGARDSVVLLDTTTNIERTVPLSGDEMLQAQPKTQQPGQPSAQQYQPPQLQSSRSAPLSGEGTPQAQPWTQQPGQPPMPQYLPPPQASPPQPSQVQDAKSAAGQKEDQQRPQWQRWMQRFRR